MVVKFAYVKVSFILIKTTDLYLRHLSIKMSTSNGSRSQKLVTLYLKQKIDLIECVESSRKRKKEIADDFGITPNTLLTIL